MMRWDANGTGGEYDVLVDGVARAEDQTFGRRDGSNGSDSGTIVGGGVERVGLYALGEGRAWFDEIYLGPDFTMGKTAICGVGWGGGGHPLEHYRGFPTWMS